MTISRKAVSLVLGCVVGSLTALACFSDRGAAPTATGGDCNIPVSTIDSMHFFVAIRDFAFHPDSLSVPPGATVTWVNCETPPQEPHTTTSDSAVWSSPELSPGSRFSRTFPDSGGFPYHCTPHPFMTGKIQVQ